MNVLRSTLMASGVALALACGSAYAQSSGGSNGGNSGSTQAGQQSGGQAGNAGMNRASGGQGMSRGTTRGCANQASTTDEHIAEANRPPGTPVQGAASKGSGDWSDQTHCGNQGVNSPAEYGKPKNSNGGG